MVKKKKDDCNSVFILYLHMTYDSYIYIILTFTLNDSIETLEAGFVVSFKDDFYMLLIDLKNIVWVLLCSLCADCIVRCE